MAEVSQPKREVDVATQHRSRRARAIHKQRMDSAWAVMDMRLAEEEEPQLALVAPDESLVSQFVSTVLHFEGWSVLEAAGAIAAVAMANSGPIEVEEDAPVLMVVGRPETARR